MFEKKIVKEKLSRIIIDRDYYKKLAENYLKEKNQTIEDCERKLKQKDEDLASQKRILENELKVKVQEATKVKVEELSQMREKNGIQAKEIEVLTKAFENMGFDVKDMKDILNKLVDGIVSKNTVNVLK
jgi:hypothetical protein